MKRLILLFCLIPALLLCSCASAPGAETQGTEPVDEPQLLLNMAREVVLAYGYGNFEDVEKYMIFTHQEQMAMLFQNQSAPYSYNGHTFVSQEAVLNQLRSHLIASDEPSFTITITGSELELHADANGPAAFGEQPEGDLQLPAGTDLTAHAATVTVYISLENGEESTGEMKVHFLKIDDQWKVYSPTVAGYFLQLYRPSSSNKS